MRLCLLLSPEAYAFLPFVGKGVFKVLEGDAIAFHPCDS